MKCKADIEAERFKDLELGFYYCLVKKTRFISQEKLVTQTDELVEVRELEYSIAGNKFFAPRYTNEKIVAFEKVEQPTAFKKKRTVFKMPEQLIKPFNKIISSIFSGSL
jgi:hypothetical protein